MSYVDFAVAISFFLFFFAVVLMFSTNYFSNLSILTKTSEFRSVSENVFTLFFESKGVPEDWDEYSITPVKVGLMEDLYIVPILVRETNGSDRTDEPVTGHVIFDGDCQNKSWNTTVRIYDEDWDELILELSNTTKCTSQFLNQSDITWEVNISANQAKKYYLYYSPDDNITDPSYTLSYNTSSWKPSDGDAWTETTTDWTRVGGVSQSVTNDTTNKIKGNSSINITDNIGSSSNLGLKYDPSSSMTDITNDWYIDVWLYLDSKADLNNFYVNISDSNGNPIQTDIFSNITSATWYHFDKLLDPNQWTESGTFDASNGIDKIIFYVVNTTSVSTTRTLKVDGLHFKKKPLTVKIFPEEQINAISSSKFDALKSISYSELKKTVGEEYKFRVKINEDSYGGNINQSVNVACHESSEILQNSNGTISKVTAKTCVWK